MLGKNEYDWKKLYETNGIICEYCGIKYDTIQEKNTHQIYYCLGRDLSLDASILKLRNNSVSKRLYSLTSNTSNFINLNNNSNLNDLNNFQATLPLVNTNQRDFLVSKNSERKAPSDNHYSNNLAKSLNSSRTSVKRVDDNIVKSNEKLDETFNENLSGKKVNNKTIGKSIASLPGSKAKNNNKQTVIANPSNKKTNRESKSKMASSSVRVYVIRLRPNQDLYKELDDFVKENNLKAAFIMTCVGSLTKATVRMAYSGQEQNEVKVFREHLEIVSLVGTLSSTGGHHLHISLSNKDGQVIGGHVFGEMNVFTTAEIVIGECSDLTFDREYDNQSGFDELVVKNRAFKN